MTTTNFPYRPSRGADPGQQIWTVWQLLQWFVATVYDIFATKFASGTGSILGGATTAVVTHNLGTGTYAVGITFTADPSAVRWWVTAKSSSQFTLNVSAAPGGAVSFDWTVKAP